MLRIGVLASHTGTNFQAIVDASRDGLLPARVALLICNNSNAPVIEKAGVASIPALHLSSATHPDDLDQSICKALQDHSVDLVVLAGYMKKLGESVLTRYEDRIINVHPSLLPKYGGAGFYGARVHQAVLEGGESVTGATVHLVNNEYDEGDILLQETIDIESSDTPESLAARLRPVEHRLLVNAIKLFADRKGAAHG